MVCSPSGWGEIGDALDGHMGESRQDSSEIVADRDLEPSAAFDDGEDRRHARSGLLAADMDPVAATSRYCAHGVFGEVVAQLQLRIVEEARQLLPQRERVAAGFSCRALG